MTAFLTTESLSLSNPELFTLHACAVAHERQGEATEAAFMAKASNLGFAVAKPWGRERYDFILDSGHNFWRVQVKSHTLRTLSDLLAHRRVIQAASLYQRSDRLPRRLHHSRGRLVRDPRRENRRTQEPLFQSAPAQPLSLGQISRSLVPDGLPE